MKKGLLILAALLLLAGCGKKEEIATSGDAQGVDATQTAQDTTENITEVAEPEAAEKGFVFETNSVTIPMNVDAAPIIEALGEPATYFEAASCAFQGLDKIYTYNGYEINTYPQGDKDFISSVYFLDDSVSTVEGIYLGSSLDDVKAAYGENYTEESGEYTYTLGQTKLSFIIEEDSVTSITYSAIVDGLEN